MTIVSVYFVLLVMVTVLWAASAAAKIDGDTGPNPGKRVSSPKRDWPSPLSTSSFDKSKSPLPSDGDVASPPSSGHRAPPTRSVLRAASGSHTSFVSSLRSLLSSATPTWNPTKSSPVDPPSVSADVSASANTIKSAEEDAGVARDRSIGRVVVDKRFGEFGAAGATSTSSAGAASDTETVIPISFLVFAGGQNHPAPNVIATTVNEALGILSRQVVNESFSEDKKMLSFFKSQWSRTHVHVLDVAQAIEQADCPLPANRGPCYNVDAQVTLSLAATPGGMIEEKFHEMMGMSIATDRLDRILHDIDPGSMLICSTATQPGHKHATGAISAPSRVLIRGKYSATSNMHRGDASVIHRSFGMMVLALGITAAIISTIFTRRRSAKESSSRIVINPPFTEASNVASQNLRKKEKAPEADLLASKALHPIIDLETGENGESLLSDLPQGRLGVVHSIGVLDPSTGQLIVRSDHGASAFSASDDVFFSEFGGTLHQALANSKQQDGPSKKWENQLTPLGLAWRSFLQKILLLRNDKINSLMYSRGLQLDLPFLTGYESHILGLVLKAFDDETSDLEGVLHQAFQNRNVSRILVSNMPRFDLVWHWGFQHKHNRAWDIWSGVPFLGFGGFPATENFPDTKGHSLSSIGRVIFGHGFWWTRIITGREGLLVDDKNASAQNLAAESNGFEAANRNQFGTYFGRKHVNQFRIEHRLTTDESIVRTFFASPASTLLNNGVEHVLRAVAKHWQNILFQPSGNFAHQRMEQIDPFEALRFHLPIVLTHLVNLRGLNKWDSQVLAPFIQTLQSIEPMDDLEPLRDIISKCKVDIVHNACGGIPSRELPLREWLDAIASATASFEEEAKQVDVLVKSVAKGISVGSEIVSRINWSIPSPEIMRTEIVKYLKGKHDDLVEGATPQLIESYGLRAAGLLGPADKRTLASLIQNDMIDTKPARLLLARAITLLGREIRRDLMSDMLRALSKGEPVKGDDMDSMLTIGSLYRIPDVLQQRYTLVKQDLDLGSTAKVYRYMGRCPETDGGKRAFKFVAVLSGQERIVTTEDGDGVFEYIPVAEAIVRAQKVFMMIETCHGKKFSYNAFMEVKRLRSQLRDLCSLSCMHCSSLDDARLRCLKSIQDAPITQVSIDSLVDGTIYYMYDGRRYIPFKPENVKDKDRLGKTLIVSIPPQNICIIGGGPTGLLTAIHNCENCIASGGMITLNEARDAFDKGASTFERAQIVRLDARWISMLRFHLGTLYEDTWIPASGETDAHLGNTLPDQGFVEITIKNLEEVLQLEVNRLASIGLLTQQSLSKMKYDPISRDLTKQGAHLKAEDMVVRNVSPDVVSLADQSTCVWKVESLDYAEPLGFESIRIGEEYEVWDTVTKKLVSYKCVGIDIDASQIKLKSSFNDTKVVEADRFPLVYVGGTKNRADPVGINFKCTQRSSEGTFAVQQVPYVECADELFKIDSSSTHIVECAGKPHGSKVHMRVTTTEPYGVCCIGGLKISMIMHNFGEKRWGRGIVDDIRSHTDQNTRIVGDFTKNVSTSKISEKMLAYLVDDEDTKDWKAYFVGVCEKSSGQKSLNSAPVINKLVEMLKDHKAIAAKARRPHLQTRFFETGDNYYLGMEFTREFDDWKEKGSNTLAKIASGTDETSIAAIRKGVYHALDRLWFSAVLEVIRTGDVYNPGARGHIPHLYLIDSCQGILLKSLPVGEAFTIVDGDDVRLEVLAKRMTGGIICRDFRGNVKTFPPSTMVFRGGNLTRGPDGNAESKVSLASFPVGHYVNHRTFLPNDTDNDVNPQTAQFIATFVGDEQSTPHFMRYSGLTGACINAMLFNEFIGRALEGRPYLDRVRQYSAETNWTNGEVVQRGTGSNYGEDGFLRPGLRYRHMLDYLRAKVNENHDLTLPPELSRDWKIKFAASLVPRGFEENTAFIQRLRQELRGELIVQITDSLPPNSESLRDTFARSADNVKEVNTPFEDSHDFWLSMAETAGGCSHKQDSQPIAAATSPILDQINTAEALEKLLEDIIAHAQGAHSRNERVSGELFNQPKPVDWIIDDFAVEAQNFTDSLVMVAALSAASLSWQLLPNFTSVGWNPMVGSAIISALIPFIAFGSITNGSRYKSRNEESREEYYDEQFHPMMMEVFSCLTAKERAKMPLEKNAYVILLDSKMLRLEETVEYYGEEEPSELRNEYESLKEKGFLESGVRSLKELIAQGLVPSKYQENSYIQKELSALYLDLIAIEDLARSSSIRDSAAGNTSSDSRALKLYEKLLHFQPTFSRSLQRGHIKWGFYKERAWRHHHLCSMIAYFYEKICRIFCLQSSDVFVSSSLCPVSIKTLHLKNQLDDLSHANSKHQPALRRRAQDFRVLYHATKEGVRTSFVIVSAWLSFITAILATVGNIGIAIHGDGRPGFNFLALVSAYSFGCITPISAVLASTYLIRKQGHLLRLNLRMGRIAPDVATTLISSTIKSVRRICLSEQISAAVGFVASLAAAVALPMNLVINQNLTTLSNMSYASTIPFALGVGSLALLLLSFLLRLYITQFQRYTLSPCFGEHIGKCFERELQGLYDEFKTRRNIVEPDEVQNRRTWEHVAREFLHRWRFDTALQTNRFGSVLSYALSGRNSFSSLDVDEESSAGGGVVPLSVA